MCTDCTHRERWQPPLYISGKLSEYAWFVGKPAVGGMTPPMMPTTLPDGEVDMDALRKKYSRPREELVAEAKAKYGDQPQEAKVSPLNEVIMCMACQAHGTVKRQYGFRVIDEVCEQCDGEGCFIKGQGKKASGELRDKVRQVENLIAAAEDLDELERLEAALKKRTIPALDEVLKEFRMARIAAAEAVDSNTKTADDTTVKGSGEDDAAPPSKAPVALD